MSDKIQLWFCLHMERGLVVCNAYADELSALRAANSRYHFADAKSVQVFTMLVERPKG